MTFQEPLRLAEAAREDLALVRSNTEGWSDDLRQRFDAQRFMPLIDANLKLVSALRRAQEDCERAMRVLNES